MAWWSRASSSAEMARRSSVAYPSASFTWGNAINLAAIPLVTGGIMLIGWYYLSSATLTRHDAEIAQIRLDSKEEKAAAVIQSAADRKGREDVRNEFLASQRQLVDVLGKLDTRLSVGEKQQDTMSRQIEKLSDLLQRGPQAKPR